MRPMLKNELLKVQERPLVRHLLPNLDNCPPRIVRVALLAIRTLMVVLHELDFKCLLHNGTFCDF